MLADIALNPYWPYLDPTTHVDSEYSRAGIMDPKIVVTTSRDPSSKLLQFSKVGTLPCTFA